ncbi:hypothetical protein HDV00_002564 [Rhizophlyctis rosea]|nr:hypothetical protein HDV00_002564 [Rhizophlyctis rosea]
MTDAEKPEQTDAQNTRAQASSPKRGRSASPTKAGSASPTKTSPTKPVQSPKKEKDQQDQQVGSPKKEAAHEGNGTEPTKSPQKEEAQPAKEESANNNGEAAPPTTPAPKKRGRPPKAKPAGNGTPAKAEADGNAKEGGDETPQRKRAKKEDSTPVTPTEGERRTPRERKSVDRLSLTQSFVKTPKPIEIPEGDGTPLKDITAIAETVQKVTKTHKFYEILLGFHTLVWGKATYKNLKQDLLNFKGFKFNTNKEHDDKLYRVHKWTLQGLKEFAQRDLAVRIFEFLKKPDAEHVKGGGSVKRKRSVSRTSKKGQSTSDELVNSDDDEEAAAGSSSKAKPATPGSGKKRGRPPKAKSAFEVFAREKRDEVSKEGGDVEAKLKEVWEGLGEEERKEYEEKFKEGGKGKGKKADAIGAENDNAKEEEEEEQDEAPSPKKAKKADSSWKGGVPTTEDLLKVVQEMIEDADLDTLTNRSVRTELEKHFGQDLRDQKAVINTLIDQTLARVSDAAAEAAAAAGDELMEEEALEEEEDEGYEQDA